MIPWAHSLDEIQMWTYIIVLRLIPYKKMGLYSQGNPFSWKMIIGTFLALILNFSMVGHGGAYGGAFALYWPMKLMDLPQFWKKDTFSRLHEGRSWGGRMEGRWNGGADGGGDFCHTWGGRWEGVSIASKAFFNSKIAIFWNECYFDH